MIKACTATESSFGTISTTPGWPFSRLKRMRWNQASKDSDHRVSLRRMGWRRWARSWSDTATASSAMGSLTMSMASGKSRSSQVGHPLGCRMCGFFMDQVAHSLVVLEECLDQYSNNASTSTDGGASGRR